MDWLLNHLQVFVVIAIVVASLLQKLKKANTQQQAREVMDTDTSERTRRVQEEIRRKIAERSGRVPPMVAPQSVGEPRSRNIFEELARQMAEAKKIAEARTRDATEEQAQQRAQAEQKARDLAEAQHLAEVRRKMQEQQRAAETAAAYRAVDPKSAALNKREKLLADLREPASLRRALVLREILGAPVGLQRTKI